MIKKQICGIEIAATMMLLLIAVNTALVVPVNAQPTEWHVYPGDSVQAAVDAAEEGDVIYLHPGYFMGCNEEIQLNKCVTIIRMEATSVQPEVDDDGNPVGETMEPFVVGDPNVFVIPASTEWTAITIQRIESSDRTPIEGVPVLTPLGTIALIGLLAGIVAVRIRKKR